ncbi:hypothetical protein HQ531_07730 [bacterium]|nr:hypothetical protein [bacterium]
MSRKLNLLAILVLSLMVMFTISCEGPAGEDGLAGVDGTNGEDGMDANAVCVTCHNTVSWASLTAAYDLSGHAAGNYVGYAGNRGSCTPCHSHEQFTGAVVDMDGEVFAATPISCATCHGNHTNLDEDVTAPLRTMAAVTGISDGTVFDFAGSSNLCGNCHQARRDGSSYAVIDTVWTDDVDGNDSLDFVVPDGSVYISSTHAGPHHGPQMNVIFGNGGYGTSSTTPHEAVGCGGCHMAEGDGTVGGHTFWPNVANCNTSGCHTDLADFDYNDIQTSFNTRMAALAEALVAEGALGGDANEGYHPAVGVVSDDVFEAFWNYMMCYEDHSHGVHNPDYIKALLTTAEAKL